MADIACTDGPRHAQESPVQRDLGLSLHAALRSHTGMDPDLANVIRQALADARAAGRDHLTQTELAVRAVLRARPDMTASESLTAVELARRS